MLSRLRSFRRLLPLAFLLAALGGGAAVPLGCASQQAGAAADPMADVRNHRLGERRRVEAVRTLWNQVEAGEIDRLAIREDLKTVAWSPAWPVALRLAALEAVTSDRTVQGTADTQNMVRLMIPREPSPEVTEFLSTLAARRGWAEATPALVRSLARLRPGIPERDRPEYSAIETLNPGRSVEEVAYDLFLDPHQDAALRASRTVVTTDRIRADAWDLLARLDLEGTRRAELILGQEAPEGPVADMQALLRDMRTLPLTGEELRWMKLMRDFAQPNHRQWWNATREAVQAVETAHSGRIQMRHLEPIRWATAHRPDWIAFSRDQLLDELRSRLDGRRFHRRAHIQGEPAPPPDRLRDWEDQLSWGDLLSILIIDEAIHQPHVVEALFIQTEQDRRDRTAEYGGLLRARRAPDGLGGPTFSAVLYPPRQSDRRGDHEFVAPVDMINQSAHALAHYHYHVQEVHNSRFAGPSPGDLTYAARFGRACLVLTSVGRGLLNVDYYQPDGIVIDLGTVRK